MMHMYKSKIEVLIEMTHEKLFTHWVRSET